MIAGGHENGIEASSWQVVYEELARRPRSELSGSELARLADALFWLDRLTDSITARREAYQLESAARDDQAAAAAAWRLFYEHWLVGEAMVARGWLARCRRHVRDSDSVAAGWLAVAESDVAMAEGHHAESRDHGERARSIGAACGDRDLEAMALQVVGRAAVALGDVGRGLGRLDEAMVMVIGDELDPLYTGWIFCNVVATCHAVADLRRANEWSDAALRWCSSLREGLLYPGLCRVYSAELACLRGEWDGAEQAARRACSELESHDERYAAAAFYLVGELCRRRGLLDEAESAFRRSNELGYVPQPGLALLELSRGRGDEALAALRSALRPGPPAPLHRGQTLLALVEVASVVGDLAAMRGAALELAEVAATTDSSLVDSLLSSARGWVALTAGSANEAIPLMRDAAEGYHALGLPYELARERYRIGIASRVIGDYMTADLEIDAARRALQGLGAVLDIASLVGAVDGETIDADIALTDRELDVLHLVAEGLTNGDVAARLFVSPHTVARHLSNIYTKLGVGSRAAATALAYKRGFIGKS